MAVDLPPAGYRRVVLSVAHDVAPLCVEAVVELARRIGADLQALLIEDTTLAALAEAAGLREFDSRSSAWRPLQGAQLQRDLNLSAAVLQRQLLRAMHGRGVSAHFTLLRATPEMAVAAVEAGDLLVIAEPGDAVARWGPSFQRLLHAALRLPVPLLYMPYRVRGRAGAVAVVALAIDDRELALAAQLAAQLHAPLRIVAPAGDAVAKAAWRAAASAIVGKAIDVDVQWATAADVQRLLPVLAEQRLRLLVCRRDRLGADATVGLRHAASYGLPLLITPS